jgi:preprotein translocase subunit SecA
MDELRKSVQNASYEQKDPLVIYKLEAYELWKKMLWDMNSKSVSTLLRGKLAVPDYEEAKAQAAAQAARQAEQQAAAAAASAQAAQMRANQQIHRERSAAPAYNPYANYSTTRDNYEANQRKAMESSYKQTPNHTPIKNTDPKVGRNDPCPCGSGKKYKNCCGR